MIARGIFQDPWLFNREELFEDKSKEDKLELLLRHARMYKDYWGEAKHFDRLKRFFKIYCRGFEGANELRDRLMHTTSVIEVEAMLST